MELGRENMQQFQRPVFPRPTAKEQRPPSLPMVPTQEAAKSSETSITVLARGIQMLSIAQLRTLMREYSISTGGNKESLRSRLIMYLETFGPNQQNLLVQFSLKLKKLLFTEDEKASAEAADVPLLAPDLFRRIIATPPCSIFETSEYPPAFGPHLFQPPLPSPISDFTLLNQGPGCVAVLQFAPVLDTPISSVTFQLCGQVMTVDESNLWLPVAHLLNKPASLQIMSITPQNPIVVVVRWVKRVPVADVVRMIMKQQTGLEEFTEPVPNGICPMSRKVIEIPGRGVGCKHSACFDLTAFISKGYESNTWICPICDGRVGPEDLRVDWKFFYLVQPGANANRPVGI
jgi:hypothetical protein